MTSKSADAGCATWRYNDAGLSSTTTIFWLVIMFGSGVSWVTRLVAGRRSAPAAPPRNASPCRARFRTATRPPSNSANLRASDSRGPSRAAASAAHVELHEVLEQVGRCLGRNADAGVADREFDVSASSMRAETRTSPSGVNLSAFEMKLRRICETFLSSVYSLISSSGSSNTSDTEDDATMGLNMPRSAANRSTISNHSGEMVMRPASTLARSSRSLTISVSSRVAPRMNSTCFCCSGVSGPSSRDNRMPAMLVIEVSGVRNSWLM
jgi:hypothetical protein